MEYLVEIYDAKGQQLESFRSFNPMVAISELGKLCEEEKGFYFVSASCYFEGAQQWSLRVD